VTAGQARDQALSTAAADAVEARTATRIAGIKITRQTINGQVREVIRDNPIYRDCVLDPAAIGLLDAARQGRTAPSSNSGRLPDPGAGPP